jgi:hypothetical protein
LALLAVSVLVACSAFVLRDSWEAFERPGPAQAQTTGNCPNAQLIDTFEGTGNQQTDTFSTTPDSFRVSYNVTGSDPATPATLLIDVVNADRPTEFVGDATQEGNGQGETFVNADPGTHYLDITFLFGKYTVTVEQCEGGGASQGVPPSSPPVSSPPPSTPIDEGPNENLLHAGGPKSGPLPLMPDGTCPEEFPVRRGGACY